MTATETAPVANRSRTVMVSFLGAIVRQCGGWMPIAGAVDLLAELGVDESIVRTAVSRLKSRGWLTAERRGSAKGYALSRLARDELAAGDAIVWHAPEPARLEDGWCIVNFTVPEAERAIRHQLRARLTTVGFGRAGAAMLIAPARALDAARRVISDLDVAARCTVFVGRYEGERDLRDLAREGWDLGELERRYDEFINTVARGVEALGDEGRVTPAAAFAHYLWTVDRWRKLPYDDPALPTEIVGASWPAARAGAVFEQTVATYEQAALDHAASHWPTD